MIHWNGSDGILQAKVEEDLAKDKRRYFKYITEREPNKQGR